MLLGTQPCRAALLHQLCTRLPFRAEKQQSPNLISWAPFQSPLQMPIQGNAHTPACTQLSSLDLTLHILEWIWISDPKP